VDMLDLLWRCLLECMAFGIGKQPFSQVFAPFMLLCLPCTWDINPSEAGCSCQCYMLAHRKNMGHLTPTHTRGMLSVVSGGSGYNEPLCFPFPLSAL
jgi:hypothetical protein